ncbi:MAG: hypothetical protein MR210_04015 [Erysipelotrichaceae bacterium]|nr:hypothetical protein [Erysipelotrichaceae bacterium]MDY5251642.1 hypothetical protein [Erysipelotrichaceae bacterium]
MNKLKEAFKEIHADQGLKNKTYANVLLEAKRDAKHHHNHLLRPLIMISCVLLVVGSSYWLYFIPVSAISIDINPSIELSINRLDRVIDVYAFNQEAKQIVDQTSLENMHYKDAISTLTNQKELEAYLQDAALEITVSCHDEKKADKMLGNVKDCMRNGQNVRYESVDYREVKNAHQNHLSCGKYAKYLMLKEYDEDITCEQVAGMSMRSINELLSQYEDNGNVNGNHGNGCHRQGQ